MSLIIAGLLGASAAALIAVTISGFSYMQKVDTRAEHALSAAHDLRSRNDNLEHNLEELRAAVRDADAAFKRLEAILARAPSEAAP